MKNKTIHHQDTKTPSKALVISGGKLNPKVAELDNSADFEMGLQLTEQYGRAVGGMTEVLKFGAMMMLLREHIDSKNLNSTRGVKLPRGVNAADGGMKAWLKRFAPQVKEATAYRFLHVAESVAESFQLPAKVSFIELATKAAAELSEKLQKKQLELWDFVNGTSQRSWLDRFAPHKPLGGRRESKKTPATPEEEAETAVNLAKLAFTDLARDVDTFFTLGHHLHLTNDLRTQLVSLFKQALEKTNHVGK
jgi:hypothetical protein